MSETAAPDARQLNRLAYAVLVGAILLPLTLAFVDRGPADYGYLVGQALVVLLVGVVLIGVFVRKKSPLTQAIGRLIVGGAVFLWVGIECFSLWYGNQQLRWAAQNVSDAMKGPSGTPRTDVRVPSSGGEKAAGADKLTVAAFLNEMAELSRAQQRELAELGSEFEKLPMGTLLAPETLSNPDRIEQARATVQQYRALITKRQSLIAEQMAASERKLKAANIGNDDKRTALETFYSNKARAIPLYQQLDSAQYESAKTVLAILDWVAPIARRITVRDGKILFQTQDQLDQYNNFMRQIHTLDARATAAIEGLTREGAARQKAIQQDLENLRR